MREQSVALRDNRSRWVPFAAGQRVGCGRSYGMLAGQDATTVAASLRVGAWAVSQAGFAVGVVEVEPTWAAGSVA